MQINLFKSSPGHVWKQTLVLFVIVIIVILAAYLIASSQDYFRAAGEDFFSLWLAPHLLLEGKSPYKPENWVPAHALYGAKWLSDSEFLYPLPLAVILIPLGLLPLEYAAVFWVALAIVTILITCRLTLSIWQLQWPYSYIIPILAGIFLFRPVAESLRLGQIDWLILLCLAVGLYFWDKQKWFTGGMIIALTVLKPQIGAPLLVFLSFWLVLRRLWLGLMGEGLIIAGLYAVGWIFNHSWLSQWLNIGIDKAAYNFCCTPTIWGLASLICKFDLNCGFTLGMVIAIILCIILFFILIPIPIGDAKFVLGLSIPVALLASPYLWTYTQAILVIPILIILGIIKRNHFSYMIAAPFTLFIALFASGIVFLSIRKGVDVLSSMVPLAIFVILLLLYRFYDHKAKLSSGDYSPI